jgi:NADH:ubiquinone oxidoreductase subunit 5 (subunit L)/multisubunit Na+/H+ antiporter MnhA subunit
MSSYEIALCLGVAAPLVMFAVLAFLGHRIGKPASGWCAVAAVLVSLGLSTYVKLGWLGMTDAAREAASAGYTPSSGSTSACMATTCPSSLRSNSMR